ncbi:MAG TPA: cell division protein FtsZ, partial [Thermoanaerobaculia bacterium]|nr:cell division protein FtsZ [Thermoanaerobaculia bacterium]
ALMGTGVAKGENRAIEAAQRAISSPLLEETSIEGAKGVLINISGGRDLGLHEVAEAAAIIHAAVDPDANIINGMVIDEALEDEMKVTVIATGFRFGGEVRPSLESSEMRPLPASPQLRPVTPVSAAPRAESPEVPIAARLAASQRGGDDPGGFGPNWAAVDDYDIPAILRKQLD